MYKFGHLVFRLCGEVIHVSDSTNLLLAPVLDVGQNNHHLNISMATTTQTVHVDSCSLPQFPSFQSYHLAVTVLYPPIGGYLE